MKTLKLSYYTIPIKLSKEDKLILVHGYTGAIDVVSSKLYAAISTSKGNIEIVSDELKEKLISRGYLTIQAKEEEIKYMKDMIKSKIRSESHQTLDVTWVVTYNCNFRCPYCFETNTSKNKTSPVTFSKEMIDKAYKAIDLYKEEYHIKKKTSMVLFGGEPLLKQNKNIVDYIVNEGNKRGYTFSAVTNGYELDSFTDLIGSDKINKLQITLDGTKTMHDKRRFHYSDGGTFDKIIKNIQTIKDKEIRIGIRMNVDKDGITEFSNLNRFLNNVGLLDNKNITIQAAKLMKHNDVDLSKRKDIEIPSMREYIDMHKRHNTINKCKDYDVKSRFLYAIKNNKPFPFRTSSCAITKGGVVLDPLGYIYPCWELVGKKDYIIGNYLLGNFVMNEKSEKWHNAFLLNDEKCMKCKFALICGGGCPKRNKEERKQNCMLFQNIFKISIENGYYEIQGKSLKYNNF